MLVHALCDEERAFLKRGVHVGVRADGRQPMVRRPQYLQTHIVSNAHGSARVRTGTDERETDVLVGIRADIAPPLVNAPNKGIITFSVDCTASASPNFEGRGAEEVNVLLECILSQMFLTDGAVDLKQLCIQPGSRCWVLNVDVCVMMANGSLIDNCALAVKAALMSTSLPRITISEQVTADGTTVDDIDVSEDPYDAIPIKADAMPVVCTVAKIGAKCIVDTTVQEEAVSSCCMHVSVDHEGTIFGVRLAGDEGIDPESMETMIEVARDTGAELARTWTARCVRSCKTAKTDREIF